MSCANEYLILSDMDGTFLGEGAALLPKNLRAIERFCKEGGLFTLATGRDARVMEILFPDAEKYLNAPAILSGGCILYDFQTKTASDVVSFPNERFLPHLLAFEKLFPNVAYRISFDRGFLCPPQRPLPFSDPQRVAPILVRERPEHDLTSTWYKIVFRAPKNVISRVAAYFRSLSLDFLEETTSDETLYELLPKGVSKASKVQSLRERFADRKIVAVGDYTNDLPLLTNADIAACPANALDSVKNISMIHLCHHRDGCIADLIDKLI